MKVKFKGWVPTVSGQLSFSAIGYSSNPQVAVNANISDGDDRYIVCYQRRNLSDALIPGLFGRFILSLGGDFRFLCIARSNKSSSTDAPLEGVLLLFDDLQQWNSLLPFITAAQVALRHYNPILGKTTTLSNHCNDSFSELKKNALNKCGLCVEFTLKRSGVCELIWDKAAYPSTAIAHMQQAIVGGVPLCLDAETAVSTACSQLFYFIKDIAHNHQHHAKSTDTIVDLHKITGDDDVRWRRDTLFALYRKAIRYKRNPNSDVFYSSLGILSYAKSFKLISEGEVCDGKNIFPVFHNGQIKDSIQAIQSTKEKVDGNRRRRDDILRGIYFSVIGIFLTLTGAMRIPQTNNFKEEPSWFLSLISHIVVVETVPALSIAITAYIIISMFLGKWRPELTGLPRATLRVLQGYPRALTCAVYVFQALIILFGTYKILELRGLFDHFFP